ncbi:serine hydrolase [Streptomyces fructofermentans]|uniref:serine hydrolase n=1 Tax=Streptomyces fructofermentans TaxID=152141 RepID=UPI00378C1546
MSPRRARPRSARPSRRRRLLHVGAASLVLLGATTAGTAYVRAHDRDGLVSSSAAPEAMEATVEPGTAPTRASGSPSQAPPTPAADPDALLAEAVEAVPLEDGARVSVAVLDLASGRSAVYGDAAFDTASIVKVDILAALLLLAQDEDRALTVQEKAYASAMIRSSDNASATALWYAIGRAEGLAAANERFGLRDTEGGDGALWGLTRTTAGDQLALLRQVFGSHSELDEDARAYLRELMGGVAEGQDWGVSAAGSDCALKNGWLPRSTTGLWDINSVGRVAADGRTYLVVALSDGNSTMAKGISLVEAVSTAAVDVLADA